MAVFRMIAQFCKKSHQRHQLASNTLITISLLGAGDIITQYIEMKIASPEKLQFQFTLPTNEELWKLTMSSFDIAQISNMLADLPKLRIAQAKNDKDDKITNKKDRDKSFIENIDWNRCRKSSICISFRFKLRN